MLQENQAGREGGGVTRILVATDAWKPQINGVVRSLESVARALREFGAEIEFLTPQGFATVPLPTDHEIRLALASCRSVEKRLDGAAIDHIHIATEGPIGFAARALLLTHEAPFHHELSYEISGIYRGPHQNPGSRHLCFSAPLS